MVRDCSWEIVSWSPYLGQVKEVFFPKGNTQGLIMEAHCFRSFMVWYLGSFKGQRVQYINLSPHNRIHSFYLNLRFLHYNTHPSGSERNGTFLWQYTCGALAGWKSALIRRCQPMPGKGWLATQSPKGNAFKHFYPERRYECWKQFLVMCFWGGPRPCLRKNLPPSSSWYSWLLFELRWKHLDIHAPSQQSLFWPVPVDFRSCGGSR